MTVDQFLVWQTPDGSDRWQLIDGAPCLMAPSSLPHGAIQAQTAALLAVYLAANRPACVAVTEPGMQPRVGADRNVRIPDIGITCTPIRNDDRLMTDPIVVIEILSRSNRAETWANVWSYTTISSVGEILVIYAYMMRIDLLRRQADGLWPENPETFLVPDAAITLDSVGFTVPLESFYRTVSL